MTNRKDRPWSAFVIMPLSDEFAWVFDDLIKPSLEEANYSMVRADSVVDQQNIMKDIVEGILRNDLVIAEITSLNPNVMYELGMSHGLQRPTIILTQDIGSAPFDLKAYRLIPYSDNYKAMNSVKAQLTDIAFKHRNGEITFGSPVTDFAPPELRSSEMREANVAAIENAAKEDGEEYQGRPGLLDRQQEILEQSEIITRRAGRITEITQDFAKNLGTRTEVLQGLAEDRSSEAQKRARIAIASVSSLMTRWGEDLEAQLPPMREAWQYFEESADELVTEASIDSEDDRAAAEALIRSMEDFKAVLENVTQHIVTVKDSLPPLRRISRDLDRAGKRADDSLSGVVDVLSEGEAIANRLANIARNRLEFD